jgi:hypothetical protein
MNPDTLKSDDGVPYSVLAVFGPAMDSTTVRDLLNVTRSAIERAALGANALAVHTSRRFGRYQRITPRLLRSLEGSDLTGFALAYVPPPETDALMLGWIRGQTAHGGGFTFVGRLDLFPPRSAAVLALIADVARIYPVLYGYHYVIDAMYGPDLHAVGIFYSQPGEGASARLTGAEERRTAAWGNRRVTAAPRGILRDVFPLNFLSEVHRKQTVNGVPLFEWIRQDDSRGRLESLTPSLWAWHVPDDRCADLGDTFEAAGLLASTPD